tara:strand:- start:256686 stop:257171 length:486 start_codon:yes stop_codon:yes gene_type:complete
MKRLIFPRILAGLVLIGIFAGTVQAHHPDRANQPVRPRVDCIGPVGNNLPPSYRRVYNRPRNLGGKIAYYVAPTSQEAIAWHRAKHMRAYECNLPRQENYYFYPKPWESLQIGPRPMGGAPNAYSSSEQGVIEEIETVELGDEMLPAPGTLSDPLMLPEDR